MPSDYRTTWTDQRLDERMSSLDRTIGLMQADIGGIRTELLEFRRQHSEEMGALRADFTSEIRSLRSELSSEIRLLRADVTTVQDRLVQIGFGLVGVLVVALASLVAALS